MTKKTTYATAINSINSDAKIMISGSDVNDLSNYDNIQWLEGTTPITKDVLDAKITELETAETTAETTKATNKTDAIAKLKASTWSPLTDDEATALFG